MAMADYRLCDVCGGKVFYDANLNYCQDRETVGSVRNAGSMMEGTKLDYLGDWIVICTECAVSHACVIVKKCSHPGCATPTNPEPCGFAECPRREK